LGISQLKLKLGKYMDSLLLHRWGKPDTIIVATNLIDAPHMTPHAIAQARLSGAKVLFVHVIAPSNLRTNPADGPLFVLPSPTLHSVQSRLNEIVKEFQHQGVLCEPIALKGLPAEQILALVHEREADRVIVETRGAEALDRILLGSVAEDLLHQVDVPVCIVGPHVRPQASPNQKPASVLIATSFRSQRPPSLHLAVELATLYHSHLTLLHVMSQEHTSEEECQRLRKQAQDELAALIAERGDVHVAATVRIRGGDPSERIIAFVSKIQAELIILGASAASRKSRLLAAGVVHRVIAEPRAPVITVRRGRARMEEQFTFAGADSADLGEN
jgi:nucleotide-binding universal stress UspA family protein